MEMISAMHHRTVLILQSQSIHYVHQIHAVIYSVNNFVVICYYSYNVIFLADWGTNNKKRNSKLGDGSKWQMVLACQQQIHQK
jgi:hypothetical protein